MSDKNSFWDSLRVDYDTMARLDNVSKNYSSKKNASSKSESPAGRERGDEGPGRQGRESGYKHGKNTRADAVRSASTRSNAGKSNGRVAAVNSSISSAKGNGNSTPNAGQANGSGQAGATSSSSSGHGQSGSGQGR